MGKHSEWRKLAKKARRKRIRQSKAKLRDELEIEEQGRRENSPSYKIWCEEQAKAEEFQAEEDARLALERELKWRRDERQAQKQWRELQTKLAIAREERAKQNEQIKIEWEREQRRQEELREKKEQELTEKLRQQDLLNEKTCNFIANGGDTPEHLNIVLQTNPNKQPCPFFQKTATCRFYDVCSRNHIRPGVSRIILITNFFTHYSLETTENEHGSDSSLEFENHETYDHYREFFNDVIPELEEFGEVKLFKTCCNHEPHLRGNVYIEYYSTQAALKSYQNLNGRWYGGKQLNVEFCIIKSWKTAICGLHFVNRCPKGNACNFLHVFRNPKNLYNNYESSSHRNSRSKARNGNDASDRRNWRWSESPERTPLVDWEDRCSMDKESSVRKRPSRSNSEISERKQHSYRQKHKRHHSKSHSKTPERSQRSRSRSSSRRSHRSYKS